jgi:hypothetical protein
MTLTAPLTFILPHGERRVRKFSSRSSSPLTREDRGGGEKINSTPHPDPLPRSGEGRKGKDLTAPLTLILSRKGREEKKDERKRMTLMTPLTFVLSRKGRERGKLKEFLKMRPPH